MIREGLRRNSGASFLAALILLIVTVPMVRHLEAGDVIQAVLMTLVLLSAVLAVGGRRRTLVIGICLVAPAVIGQWVDHFRPGLVPAALIRTMAMVFVAFIIVHHLHFVLTAPRVNAEVLCAGVSTYLMLGLLWAFAYILVAGIEPSAFALTSGPSEHRVMAGFEAMFYSLSTLSGGAVADISPASDIARMLTMMEGIVGIFYLAILIARLVSLYSTEPK